MLIFPKIQKFLSNHKNIYYFLKKKFIENCNYNKN